EIGANPLGWPAYPACCAYTVCCCASAICCEYIACSRAGSGMTPPPYMGIGLWARLAWATAIVNAAQMDATRNWIDMTRLAERNGSLLSRTTRLALRQSDRCRRHNR